MYPHVLANNAKCISYDELSYTKTLSHLSMSLPTEAIAVCCGLLDVLNGPLNLLIAAAL